MLSALRSSRWLLLLVLILSLTDAPLRAAPPGAVDPGPRLGPSNAGQPLPGLTAAQLDLFNEGRAEFVDVEGVGDGLGPRFNLDSCGGCHSQPAIGGSSPAVNPQVVAATVFGGRNTPPPFITATGPVREVRLPLNPDGSPDGGVHDLYVISGRVDTTGDASTCPLVQEDFSGPLRDGNIIFRIPTPVFGAGLLEQIPDSTILANLQANAAAAAALGIHGHVNKKTAVAGDPNRNGNDGTVTRFGWKAQNKSLLLFAGEAYNVEMGITNELFQTEREEMSPCQYAPTPNTVTPDTQTHAPIVRFANFMRFLDQPRPSPDTPGGADSIKRGRAAFASTVPGQGAACTLCHTASLLTGDSMVEALSQKKAVLWSDLALHQMGPALADNVSQGAAAGDEFRTAPLWGLGQRLFFLHDGRTTDLMEAIQLHASGHGNGKKAASEATASIALFNQLPVALQQDILNFLRAL
jgi:CxxC motif-containing protein (DUF1111 family)